VKATGTFLLAKSVFYLMTIVSFSRKFLFIKSRKTAGTSVQLSLLPHLSGKDMVTKEWTDIRTNRLCVIQEFASVEDIHLNFPETVGYFSFGFTRNPFALTLSRYFYQIKMNRIVEPATPENFNRWAQNVYFKGEPRFPGGRFLLDRSRYLLFTEALVPKVDFIGKVENLSADFAQIKTAIGLQAACLLHENQSNDGNFSYHDWMDQKTRQLVEEGFDFELANFGYDF